MFDLEKMLIGMGIALGLGWLIPSPFSWFSRRKQLKENHSLREHLHRKMEIDAEGMGKLKDEVDQLKQMNENLRITNQTLRNKPGRAELRLLQIYDQAINVMLVKVPGFAPSWQTVLEGIEKEMNQTDQGLRAFVKKVLRPSKQLEGLSTESVRLMKRNDEREI